MLQVTKLWSTPAYRTMFSRDISEQTNEYSSRRESTGTDFGLAPKLRFRTKSLDKNQKVVLGRITGQQLR